MAPITTTCAGCGRTHTIPDRYLGRELKCPACGHPLTLDAPPPAPAAAAQAPVAPAETAGTVFPEAPPAPAPPAPPAAAQAPEAPPETVAAADDGAAEVYWRVRRLGVLSTATVGAVLHGLLGVLVGVAVAAVSLVGRRLALPAPLGPLAGIVALVAAPVVYAAVGFAFGALLAVVYNLAARLTGGVKVLLE
jgi:hypothetical protein